jgi:hypothetical protein
MGLLSVTKKIARQGTQVVTAKQSECACCGKPLRSTKSNICSKACAQFLAESY